MFLVIDLEATCDQPAWPVQDMEVIEIGACWATPDGEVVDTFQRFVQPLLKPVLTPFCMALTHVRQEHVNTAHRWPAVAAELAAFAHLHPQPGGVWASWGHYDAHQIAVECTRHQVPDPLAGLTHRNLKNAFARRHHMPPPSLASALQIAGLDMLGHPHRALVDACNTARLLPFCL